MANIEEIMRREFEFSVQYIAEHKGREVLPHYILWNDQNEMTIVGCHWDNSEDKQVSMQLTRLMAIAVNATRAVFVSEVWAVEAKDEDIGCAPKDHPDKVENLMIIGRDHDHIVAQVWPIVRKEDGSRLVDVDKVKDMGNLEYDRMSNVVPPKDMKLTDEQREFARTIVEKSGMAHAMDTFPMRGTVH